MKNRAKSARRPRLSETWERDRLQLVPSGWISSVFKSLSAPAPCLMALVTPRNVTVTDNSFCRLPMEPGHCYARERAWYYDVLTGNCERFIYTGCGGNENRFNYMETCVMVCGGKEFRNADDAEEEGEGGDDDFDDDYGGDY